MSLWDKINSMSTIMFKIESIIQIGNFVAKICYVLCLIASVYYGSFLLQVDTLSGSIAIILGLLLATLCFYLIFIFIDIRQQLVNLNAKLDKTENKENL